MHRRPVGAHRRPSTVPRRSATTTTPATCPAPSSSTSTPSSPPRPARVGGTRCPNPPTSCSGPAPVPASAELIRVVRLRRHASRTPRARAWWVLRWLGIADVRVLDGGYAAWLGGRAPRVARWSPSAAAGDVVGARGSACRRIDATGSGAGPRTACCSMPEPPERYAGETEPIDPVAGHVPGAVSCPTTDWLAADGHLPPRPRRALGRVRCSRRPRGAEVGGIGVYCGSGVTAAHHVLALAQLGVEATLYPGSWSEWMRDPRRPSPPAAPPPDRSSAVAAKGSGPPPGQNPSPVRRTAHPERATRPRTPAPPRDCRIAARSAASSHRPSTTSRPVPRTVEQAAGRRRDGLGRPSR